MRLKIKYTSTKKFVLNFNGKTLGELTEAVKSFVTDTYSEACPEFALSLNGREALAGSQDSLLSELGIVASDLITVLPGVAPGVTSGTGGGSGAAGGSGSGATGGSGSGAAGGNGSGAAGGSGSDTASGSGSAGGAGGNSQPQQPPAAGVASGGAAAASVPVVFAPSTLLEISDSSTTQAGGTAQPLPSSLQSLLAHCLPKDASQAVNLLAHITMLECDFKAPDSAPSANTPSPGWDGPVASLNYVHKSFSSFTCTLVLVSMGDMKQMLVSFPGQDVEISTKVNVRDYISDDKSTPVEGSSLRNVSRLAKHLRNELLVPLQLAAHRILDVPSPKHLAGLPLELLFLVLKHLDAPSLLKLSRCCKRLHSAATDDAVWLALYKRDFGNSPPPSLAGGSLRGLTNWLARYKKRYLERKARNIGWEDPRHQIINPPNIFPSPHPRIYPIGPLNPGYPNHPHGPQPVGPYPVVPDPTPPFNPYGDPDSPYYGGDLPNGPPQRFPPPNPLGPLHGGDPLNPFGADPLNPFGDPSFGGLGPGLPGRRNQPRGFPRGGPGFRFI